MIETEHKWFKKDKFIFYDILSSKILIVIFHPEKFSLSSKMAGWKIKK